MATYVLTLTLSYMKFNFLIRFSWNDFYSQVDYTYKFKAATKFFQFK